MQQFFCLYGYSNDFLNVQPCKIHESDMKNISLQTPKLIILSRSPNIMDRHINQSRKLFEMKKKETSNENKLTLPKKNMTLC
jgi:hypothetical protein